MRGSGITKKKKKTTTREEPDADERGGGEWPVFRVPPLWAWSTFPVMTAAAQLTAKCHHGREYNYPSMQNVQSTISPNAELKSTIPVNAYVRVQFSPMQ